MTSEEYLNNVWEDTWNAVLEVSTLISEIEDQSERNFMKKQTIKDKIDEKLGAKYGKESGKKQTMKDRRDESKMKKGNC